MDKRAYNKVTKLMGVIDVFIDLLFFFFRLYMTHSGFKTGLLTN